MGKEKEQPFGLLCKCLNGKQSSRVLMYSIFSSYHALYTIFISTLGALLFLVFSNPVTGANLLDFNQLL
jgi:hypothetical protein